jgi:hypothetical protein
MEAFERLSPEECLLFMVKAAMDSAEPLSAASEKVVQAASDTLARWRRDRTITPEQKRVAADALFSKLGWTAPFYRLKA